MICWDLIGLIGVVLTLLENYYAILSGRLLEGIMLGVHFTVAPLYIIEFAPMKFKGIAGSFNVYLLTLFVLFAYLVGYTIPEELPAGETSNMWRVAYGFIAVPLIVQVIGLITVYKDETPFFLVKEWHICPATTVLKKIYLEDPQPVLDSLIRDREA